jgi:hypothetical protein
MSTGIPPRTIQVAECLSCGTAAAQGEHACAICGGLLRVSWRCPKCQRQVDPEVSCKHCAEIPPIPQPTPGSSKPTRPVRRFLAGVATGLGVGILLWMVADFLSWALGIDLSFPWRRAGVCATLWGLLGLLRISRNEPVRLALLLALFGAMFGMLAGWIHWLGAGLALGLLLSLRACATDRKT